MNITAAEKLMYAVMEAIYNSGIPISFKGSMVLKAASLKQGIPKKPGTRLISMQTGILPLLRQWNKWSLHCKRQFKKAVSV